jgi:ABC-type polysaccharide/polyol phosphate export permease
MISDLYVHRRTIWNLALYQFRDRYSGTAGGILWAVVHPVLLLTVFWVVFSQGLKLPGTGNQPFLLSMFCALIPWMTFADALSNATSAITGRSYMVKKIAFPSEILPITSLVGAFLTHLVLLMLLALMFAAYGRAPTAGMLLLPYYLAALAVLALGFAMLLSAVNVFFRDVGQSLAIVLNLWFWLTPIVWPPEMLPPRFSWLLAWNPVNYVVEGYRSALLGTGSPWPPLAATLGFWLFAGGLSIGGWWVFRRLKTSFADAL